MAQKPNFLKKIISAGLVTASTAAFITAASSTAMGAANRNINANVNLEAAGIPGIVSGDSLTYVVQAGGPYTATATGGNDNAGNATVLFGSINMLQNGVFALNGADITIGSVSGTANALLTININSANTLTLNGAPGVAAFPVNTYTNVGPVNFRDAAAVFKVSLAANGADGTKTATFGNGATFNGAAAGQGVIEIDAGNIAIFNGTIGNANGIDFLTLKGNAQATLNANAKFDGTVGGRGIDLGAGAILNVADGVNITGVTAANNISIDGAAANNGTVNFLGNSTVSADVGIGGNNLNAINVAGELTFQGGNNGGGGTLAAANVNLTTANSLVKFTTQRHTVTANILNTSGTNNQGGISVNGGDVTIKGNIGANNASLATINFETDNGLAINSPGAAFFVQNVTTATANKGSLQLQGANLAINGNIGSNNALKIVNLANDGAGVPADTNFTLKQGSSINAQNIYLSATQDNTLTLEEGTTITGDIINKMAAGKGTITLTGNATINGDIGVAGQAGGGVSIKVVNLGGKDLTFNGQNILVGGANGISFTANEKLILTNATDPIVINSNVIVGAAGQGIIDGSALTNAQTLNIQNATIGLANKALGLLNIGSSKASVSGGDVYLNELAIGNNGSLQLAHNSYLITKTTNASGQGKIIFNPTAADNTTLVDGTNLGSAANPLLEINIAAPAGGADTTINIGKGVNLYANNITTAGKGTGSFNFAAGGINTVSGTLGDNANKLNEVNVENGTTAYFLGNATFAGASTIDNTSTLQIGGNYTADSIVGAAANNGTLQFVNADEAIVTLNNQANAVNALATVKVSAPGNVKFVATGNGANPGINIGASTINFTDASLGTALFLPTGVALDNLTITSSVGNKVAGGGINFPFVIVSGADSTIGNNAAIGSQGNIVGLGLATDNKIDVNATTLYAALGSVSDGQGTITLNGGTNTTAGTVYGLGAGNGQPKLKLVTVITNYTNLGNVTATNLVVNDGLTFTTGGAYGLGFDGKITLGSANGNSKAVFADKINSTASSIVATSKANNGTVTYLGNATVGNIGDASNPVASVQFNGAAGSLAKLQSAIYSQATNFNNYNLAVIAKGAIISGTNSINGNISLGTNSLTFANGTSTWGGNSSLTTSLTVSNGNIGNITISEGAQVNSESTLPVTVNIQDTGSAIFSGTQTYTLIYGGSRFNGTFGTPSFVANGSNRFINYGIIRADNGDYQITRVSNALNTSNEDLTSNGYSGTPNVKQNLEALFNTNNTGNALLAAENGTLAKNTSDSAKYFGAIVTDTSAATSNALFGVAKEIQSMTGYRVDELRYLGTPESAEMASPEGGAAVSSGDEPVDNVAYGAWVKPLYAEAHQSAKGGVAGYKAKTTGAVIGLDTLANDNLMIGASLGITKTDVKHQNYKKGDKTDINGFAFSLYGAQQLVSNFFVHGNAIFSLNHVKNKSQRYVFDNNGNMSRQIASGNYDNMTFGGNVMVGYDAKLIDGILVTPMAGVSYLNSSNESYKETGTTFLNRQVSSRFSDRTDLIAGAKVFGGTMNITDIALYPEAHAFIAHKVNGKLAKSQYQLDGQVNPFISQPDKTSKTTYNLGLSLTARPDNKMEYGIGYDANIASKFVSHQGTLKVRVNF